MGPRVMVLLVLLALRMADHFLGYVLQLRALEVAGSAGVAEDYRFFTELWNWAWWGLVVATLLFREEWLMPGWPVRERLAKKPSEL